MACLVPLGPSALGFPFQQTGCLAACQTQRIGDLAGVQPQQLGRAAGGAEHAAGSSGVEALIVGLALKGLAQANGDLGAIGKGGDYIFTALFVLLGQSQNSGKYHHRGVLRAIAVVVVHIEGVAEGAVDEGRHLS